VVVEQVTPGFEDRPDCDSSKGLFGCQGFRSKGRCNQGRGGECEAGGGKEASSPSQASGKQSCTKGHS
jgi:hypothetical protein